MIKESQLITISEYNTMAKAPTWPLPEGEGQGPRPNPNPVRLAKKKKKKVLLDSKAIWKG